MARHIIIIGAGLGGPALALSLAKHAIASTIYEIRPSPSQSGGSISLGPEGLKVLDKYCGVYDRLKTMGYSYRSFGAYTSEGEKLGTIQVGNGAYPAMRIMRKDLQQVLLDACEATGRVKIRYGAVMQSIEEGEDGVAVHFDDGSSDHGEVVVGADGIHSKVRDYILGPDRTIQPTYDGICVVNGFLPSSSVVLPRAGDNDETPGTGTFTLPAFFFTPHGMIMSIPIDPKGETIAWGINKALPDRSRQAWRQLEESGEAARVAKADYADCPTQPLRSLLDSADDAAAKLWATYSIPEVDQWSSTAGRVVIMGDAAHGMPPNGQGSAMAFEDAAILARLLVEREDLAPGEMFARFQKARKPRVDGVRRNSKGPGAAKRGSGTVGWYLKKWAMRGYFWWNSGELKMSHGNEYDVDTVDLS